MEEQNIVIKIRDGDPLLVSKDRLTAESRMFRYLIEELKYDALEMDDFTPEAVTLFLTLLEDKQNERLKIICTKRYINFLEYSKLSG